MGAHLLQARHAVGMVPTKAAISVNGGRSLGGRRFGELGGAGAVWVPSSAAGGFYSLGYTVDGGHLIFDGSRIRNKSAVMRPRSALLTERPLRRWPRSRGRKALGRAARNPGRHWRRGPPRCRDRRRRHRRARPISGRFDRELDRILATFGTESGEPPHAPQNVIRGRPRATL